MQRSLIADESIMAGNVVVAGLLIFVCVQSGSSQGVPDGVVYTEVKKTLLQGIPGVLSCRFYGQPYAVYWEKGPDSDNLTPMIVWHEGQVSGPRYDDGSYDIDSTFSLVIRNVSLTDAGRIYCTVSNHRGILIKNYSDVSITATAIATRPHVTIQMEQGTYGILQCTVHIKARMVSWTKGQTSRGNKTLVVLGNVENRAVISGVGYDEGMYNITEDYSLIIRNVQVHHEGLYICEVIDYDTGFSFQNHSLVNVIAQPLSPFPTIQECMDTEQDDSYYCALDAKSEMTLTCQVTRYYPDMNLFFMRASKVVEPFSAMEWNNTDGTKNKTVTISASGSKELYTCIAANIPGFNGNTSTSVLLHDEQQFDAVLVIIIVLFAALAVLSLLAYFIWRKRHRHSDSNYPDYTQVGQDERVELQHYDDKDVRDLTLEEYEDLLERVDDALMKHYRRIYDLIDTKSTLQAEKIIDENKTALFNTEQMLNDWHQNPESTYRQYMKVMQGATPTEDKTDNAWPCNEELRWISRHLNQESMKEICKKLNITYKTEDNDDEEKRYNTLRGWRNKVAHENVKTNYSQFSSAIGSKNLMIRGLLPPLRGKFIYKAELVDMAFSLLMQDLLPVAEALGINTTKLVSYRPAFQPSHLEMGTIDLLPKLLNSITVSWEKKFVNKGDFRNIFCNEIGKQRYRNVATCGIVAYEMSYGELYAIREAMSSTIGKAIHSQGDISEAGTQSEEGKSEKGVPSEIPEDGKEAIASITEKAVVSQGDTSKAVTQCEDDKCEKGAASKIPEDGNKEETDTENLESEIPLLAVSKNQIPAPEKAFEETETMDRRTGIHVVEIPEDLHVLRSALQLTDQDIADGLGSSHPITAHALFKIWKEMPRPSVFNYRAALAHELRRIQIPDLADKVIAGNYIKEQTSLEFIQNMVQGLSTDQPCELRSLEKLLGLSGKDGQWHTSTPFDEICLQIYEWLASWTKEMKSRNVVTAGFTGAFESFKEVAPKLTTKSEKHRELNNKLVEQGFLDLAREVMIIEQQIKYVKSNVKES